jgi:hypothetical protein
MPISNQVFETPTNAALTDAPTGITSAQDKEALQALEEEAVTSTTIDTQSEAPDASLMSVAAIVVSVVIGLLVTGIAIYLKLHLGKIKSKMFKVAPALACMHATANEYHQMYKTHQLLHTRDILVHTGPAGEPS